MLVSKASIIADIQRTASENDGVPLGRNAFERETGVSRGSWCGKYWRTWSDALNEAGFPANDKQQAYEKSFLILSLVLLTQKNRRFPTHADIGMEKRINPAFPGGGTFLKLGTPEQRIELVRKYATDNVEHAEILELLPKRQLEAPDEVPNAFTGKATKEGYVYIGLLKIGSTKRYKIGNTNLVERRKDQLSVQLPEDLELVHVIKTDDACGIEAYWHHRFAAKRTKGEWFTLKQDDLRAFKRRKFM